MNKIIIIGASSGIGHELARQYATQNKRVGVTARRGELLERLQAAFPENILISCFDATGKEACLHLEKLIDDLGGMDLLIFNAGFGEPAKELNLEIDKATTDIHVNAFLNIIHFGYDFFMKQGWGHLAVTSSVASKRGNDYAPAYSASKAFQSIYFEGLHMKLKKLKLPIYSTDIQPGFVDTKMAKSNKRFWVAPVEEAAKQIIEAIEKKKWRVYITRRWKLIAGLLPWIPDFIYHRVR